MSRDDLHHERGRGRPPLPLEKVSAMQAFRAQGKTCAEVATEFCVSKQTAHVYTRNHRTVERRGGRHRGPEDPAREADIIRRVPNEGLTPSAKSHGITRQRVHQIVRAYTKRTGDAVQVKHSRAVANVAHAG